MSLIVADGLTKTYITGTVRVEALRDLTLTIDRASFVSFIGPSGSGKTTLLNLLGTLDVAYCRGPTACWRPKPYGGSAPADTTRPRRTRY